MPSVALPLSSELVSRALGSTLKLISKNPSNFLNKKQLSKKERRKKKKLERKLQRKYGSSSTTCSSPNKPVLVPQKFGSVVDSESGGDDDSCPEDFDCENWTSSANNPPLEFETEGPQVSTFTLSLREKYNTCVNNKKNKKKMNTCLSNGDAHPQQQSPSKSTTTAKNSTTTLSSSTSTSTNSTLTYGTVEEAVLKPSNNNIKSVNGTSINGASINGTNGHHKSDLGQHKSEQNGPKPNGIIIHNPKKLIQSNLTGFVNKEKKKLDEKVNTVVTLPEPKVVLYSRSKIKPGWRIKPPIGVGFINLGNTCYMNATLQALFHTPAFFNWLVDEVHSGDHKRKCERNGQSMHQCTLCPMTNAVLGAYNKNQAPIRPVMIHNKLKTIGKNFGYGRQEDAHEFLRLLLESMERSYLTAVGGNRLDNRSKETTPLGQIFGGYTRGEVRCLTCRHVSTTFHPLAELQLDIREVNNVEDALSFYFQKERLNNNDYKCERCKTVQPATKQQFMELAPIVLCIQLKRFRACGSKIKKPIFVNERLNLRRFMYNQSQDNDRPQATEYKLVGLVTHMGPSPNCGHYTAIAQASNGNFYHFDDSYVRMTNLNYAQNADAYVIIYEMVDRNNRPSASATSTSSTAPRISATTTSTSTSSSSSTSPKTASTAATSTRFIGPQLPPGGIKSNPSSSPPKPSMPSNNNSNLTPKIVKSITTGLSSSPLKKSGVVNGIGVKTSFTISRNNSTLGPSAKIFQKNSNSTGQLSSSKASPMKNGTTTTVTKLVAYGDSEDEDQGQERSPKCQGTEGNTNGGVSGEVKKSYRPPSPPKIKSWSNDQESKLGKVMELERKRPFVKTKEELEDEEIDAGRQKKKAKSHSPELSRQESSSSRENPFNKQSSSS